MANAVFFPDLFCVQIDCRCLVYNKMVLESHRVVVVSAGVFPEGDVQPEYSKFRGRHVIC